MNYEFYIIKFGIFYLVINNIYIYEFMNMVYMEKFYFYVGMRNIGVIEVCFS